MRVVLLVLVAASKSVVGADDELIKGKSRRVLSFSETDAERTDTVELCVRLRLDRRSEVDRQCF